MSALGSYAKLLSYGQRGERLQRWSDGSNHAAVLLDKIAGWSAVYLLVLQNVGLHLGWSSLETSPLARTAEPPNLEISEVDDPDGEAVPHMEDFPEAPRQPTAGRKMVDTETQSARSPAAILEWTYSQTTKMRIFVVAAILGNVVSVTLFDVLVLFTGIIDHEHGKSRDGSVQWH